MAAQGPPGTARTERPVKTEAAKRRPLATHTGQEATEALRGPAESALRAAMAVTQPSLWRAWTSPGYRTIWPYPAGPGGYFHGAIPGLRGAAGVNGGAGSGGAAGGTGGQSNATEGLGGTNILLVSPNITVNALVSANGGNGSNAPVFGSPGGPTKGADASGGSNGGGGGGGSGAGGGGGGAGGLVQFFSGSLAENVTAQANPGTGGLGAAGAAGGAKDGTGHAGGKGGKGADGATGSPGFVIRQRIL